MSHRIALREEADAVCPVVTSDEGRCTSGMIHALYVVGSEHFHARVGIVTRERMVFLLTRAVLLKHPWLPSLAIGVLGLRP